MANPFDIFLTSSIRLRKPDGTLSPLIKALVDKSQIHIHDTSLSIEPGDVAIRDLPNGKQEFFEIKSVEFEEGFPDHIPAKFALNCRKRDAMPVFGSHCPVTIVRAPNTPDEKRWETQMGGDLSRKALFYIEDKVRTGDEIHAEIFDEPRVISRVDPVMMMQGVSHWQAEMMSQSEWQLRHRASHPSITVSGTGARVNVHSLDQSTQNFQNVRNEHVAITELLDQIKALVEKNASSTEQRNDAMLDVEQIKMEMQRSKPDKGRLAGLVERLGLVAGLAEKLTDLYQRLQQLF